MTKKYNIKEAYILQQTAKKVLKGELIVYTPDVFQKKIYSTVLEKDYEITIREMSTH